MPNDRIKTLQPHRVQVFSQVSMIIISINKYIISLISYSYSWSMKCLESQLHEIKYISSRTSTMPSLLPDSTVNTRPYLYSLVLWNLYFL